MFEQLTERIGAIFQRLGGQGKVGEKDLDEALRQVRLALLEADVHLQVARDFIARVREQALGAKVMESLTPAQQVIKIVRDELTALLGAAHTPLAAAPRPPTVLMLVGLQGSGKTTTAAKLALRLKSSGGKPVLVAADPRRPAAREQLAALGRGLGVPVSTGGDTALEMAQAGLKLVGEQGASALILDTAGRLHIDEALMAELAELKAALSPHEVLLVADAMTGQDAVQTAQAFQERVGLTGLILTKLDGDARGGAALSIRAVTGVPIKFIGTGERPEALEPFHPERLASRILGMGDVLSFIERAQATVETEKAKELERKVRHATFNLEDMLEQIRQVKKMGPVSSLVDMLPGAAKLRKAVEAGAEEKQMKKVEAIIQSMTPRERRQPQIIDGRRRRRIARGSGTTPQDVNQVLNQHQMMLKFMKQMKGRGPFRPRGL
ncbi:MAG: signal recognition particle protein [Chloroflexi bacterium]|nr:signal recognition particle protein [Chloroflexota bacterium]